MVEAAGVEPASEGVTGREPTYLVAFPLPTQGKHSRPALRTRQETQSASPGSRFRARAAGTTPASKLTGAGDAETSLLCDALSPPVGEAVEDGYLTN